MLCKRNNYYLCGKRIRGNSFYEIHSIRKNLRKCNLKIHTKKRWAKPVLHFVENSFSNATVSNRFETSKRNENNHYGFDYINDHTRKAKSIYFFISNAYNDVYQKRRRTRNRCCKVYRLNALQTNLQFVRRRSV